jgi:hypothetical protein
MPSLEESGILDSSLLQEWEVDGSVCLVGMGVRSAFMCVSPSFQVASSLSLRQERSQW